MVTPELLNYIRGEFGSGRTREQIKNELLKNGGWGEADLSDAFRTVNPMEGVASPVLTSLSTSAPSSISPMRVILFVVILAGLFSLYFFRTPILAVWQSGMEKVSGLSDTKDPSGDTLPINNGIVKSPSIQIKNCGTSVAPDPKKPTAYQIDSVLDCMGLSALACTPAKAFLEDDFFPTNLEITKNQNVCNFKLSYGEESELLDVTGQSLAGQYVMCPLSIVKMVDESTKTPVFKMPTKDNSSKYAAEIYFYGKLGLFMEQGVDKSKILSLGCTGPYIDAVVASYQKAQSDR